MDISLKERFLQETIMHSSLSSEPQPVVSVELATELSVADMDALCDVTRSVIEESRGFGWQRPPTRHVLERFWQGVLVVPERILILARIDNTICGAVQLVKPTRHNEMQSFAVSLLGCFVASWAQGYDVGTKLVEIAENLAIEKGFNVINVDVQETEQDAKAMFESMGYTCWGVHPHYARINGHIVRGLFYTKLLHSDFSSFQENHDDMFLEIVGKP